MESLPLLFLLIEFEDGTTVRGGSDIERYENRIMIESFTFGMENLQNQVRQSTEQTTSKAKPDRVKITRAFDATSIKLSRLVKAGTEFKEARLTVDQHKIWSAGEEREQNAIIVYHLWYGRIEELNWITSESGKGASIKETLTLGFKQVTMEYYEMDFTARDKEGRTFRKDAPHPFAYLPPLHED